jgi:type IV pilus assembly protein PilB
LKSLNDESVNITTIEDPIEIKLEGINQSQVNAKAGITFASCMRAILRQDPDIILVGEIRDYETLETAISAALTGHLVLSTVHTNSAAATVTRLIEMGAKDYLVSSTLTGVIAQRLVRHLCDDCKQMYHCTREEAEKVTLDEAEIQKLMATPIYKPVGCPSCAYQGYKGRMGVYEIMPITKEIKKLIAQGAHDLEIEECAVKDGMTTLNASCYKHIIEGRTSIDEHVRVLGLAGE